MKALGLLHPVHVWLRGDAVEVVAGAHRARAAESLG